MNRIRLVLAGSAAAVMAVALTSCGNAADTEATSPTPTPTVMQTPDEASAAAHNQADVMFARHMIPHHEQAIEMSDLIIEKPGIDPRVIELANEIKVAQNPEIEQMQSWLDQWGMPGDHRMPGDMPHHGDMNHEPMTPGMPGMDGMAGMMSPADMQALADSQGVDASRLFLDQMIEHHEGAITMAQDEIANGQFPEAVELAHSIITSQQQEIETMNQLLNSLS
ncbi:DUF305 domain-containing protein [Mycobacterium sp. SMC-4]|uniref:DUF305 domain-containing protein n=1 Tax=Mycobacterium sp. SMC-4 TaxID=2857059 RepID=UPI0021B323AF|nr:DUF305 domain-containing protein [Mycobacterium sp. SMC-4]UXA21035.1 DUF305 domain-containing protein [Mycobacterium sp. SMC-4]